MRELKYKFINIKRIYKIAAYAWSLSLWLLLLLLVGTVGCAENRGRDCLSIGRDGSSREECVIIIIIRRDMDGWLSS